MNEIETRLKYKTGHTAGYWLSMGEIDQLMTPPICKRILVIIGIKKLSFPVWACVPLYKGHSVCWSV